MNSKRILVISALPMFLEAIVHVLEEQGISVVATAGSLAAAWPLIQQHQPDTIIIDAEENYPPGNDVITLLTDSAEDRQVIFLTLSSNQMIVHQRHVGDATPANLVSLLRSSQRPTPGAGPGGWN